MKTLKTVEALTTPLGLPQWLAGFCATLKLVAISVAQKPVNHRGKPDGDFCRTCKVRHPHFALCILHSPPFPLPTALRCDSGRRVSDSAEFFLAS